MGNKVNIACFYERMFSRNRFNGQHGAGVSPKSGAKSKTHPPKKRAPNPKVALVIRGKIHRLLQGSADHRVPDSQLYYPGAEQDGEEVDAPDGQKELRSINPRVTARAEASPPKGSIIKRHAVVSGPPCVGEVELNREGCIRLPCTLQHKSSRSQGNQKRISFESGLREPPEHIQPVPLYSPVSPDMNGTKFASGTREYPSPRIRPKRPYSAGDYLDYNFNRALPNTLLEEDEDKEEVSSAIIDHILKELRGINKIQEEISDLRDYLTSVRGSVEEVSSCVDAVLLEIEGIRSSNKGGSNTWSGSREGPSTRRRPVSAYGSLGSPGLKSDPDCFQPGYEDHNIHEALLPTRLEGSREYKIAGIADHQELEEPDDNSDHSSDIPEGATARNLSLSFLEHMDGQDFPSTSSLSSGHSSKSEYDLVEQLSRHERQEQRVVNEEEWTKTMPPRSVRRVSKRHEDSTYLRNRGVEEKISKSSHCCEGAENWDHYREAGGYGTSLQSSTVSSEPGSFSSKKHYNSPASTSTRNQRQSLLRRPQSQSRIHDPTVNSSGNSSIGFEYSADLSYPQSSGYHSIEVNDGEAEELEFDQTNELNFTMNSETETYLSYEDNSAVTWTEGLSGISGDSVSRPYSSRSWENRLSDPGNADVPAGGSTVKRIGRAVLDFRSALRGALRKLEGPVGLNPGDQPDFELSMPSYELPLKRFSNEECSEQTSNQFQEGDVISGHVFDDLSKNTTTEKSSNLSLEPLVAKTNISLALDSLETCHSPHYRNSIPPCSEESSLGPDNFDTRTGVPEDVIEVPGESSSKNSKGHEDVGEEEELFQCTTAESLSASIQTDEPAALEERLPTQAPQQPVKDIIGDLEVKPEGDAVESSTDMTQSDERKLKCLRTFQQILREKRETRHNLVSMTISNFSHEDMEQGSKYFELWSSLSMLLASL